MTNIFKNVGKRMVAGITAAVMAVMSLPLQSFAEEGILHPCKVDDMSFSFCEKAQKAILYFV